MTRTLATTLPQGYPALKFLVPVPSLPCALASDTRSHGPQRASRSSKTAEVRHAEGKRDEACERARRTIQSSRSSLFSKASARLGLPRAARVSKRTRAS